MGGDGVEKGEMVDLDAVVDMVACVDAVGITLDLADEDGEGFMVDVVVIGVLGVCDVCCDNGTLAGRFIGVDMG